LPPRPSAPAPEENDQIGMMLARPDALRGSATGSLPRAR